MPDSFPDLQSRDSATLPDGRILDRADVEKGVANLVDQLSERDRPYFQQHSERFVETFLRMASVVRPGMKLLVAGDWCCFASALAREIFDLRDIVTLDRKDGEIAFQLTTGLVAGFQRTGVDLEQATWPVETGSIDLTLSQEILEHFPTDPMHFMLECRRVLAEEGVLVTTTPNASSLQGIWNAIHRRNPVSFGVFDSEGIEHPKEYSPEELDLIHRNAGLSPILHETFSPYGKPELPELRDALRPLGWQEEMAGQVQILAARATSPPKFRRYGPLYTTRVPVGTGGKEIPDPAAHAHQWWGDCPLPETTPKAPEAAAAEPAENPPSPVPSRSGSERVSPRWPGSLMGESDLRLVRACLLPRGVAEAEYLQWREEESLDSQPTPVIKLLPILYRRLLTWERSDLPEIDRLKGIHRYYWAKTQSLLRHKDQLARHLAESGVPSLLLKGAALNLAYYRTPEIRPMDDFDLLVPGEKGPEAIRLLEEMGWRMVGRIPQSRDDGEFSRYLHALAFRSSRDGALLDLHCHLTQFHLRPEDDAFFWERSREFSFGEATVRLPSAEDLVFHLIVHLVQYSSSPGLLWPVDVVRILDREGENFDWQKLVAAADHSNMAPPVGRALGFLRDVIGLEDRIPSSVVEELHQRPGSLLQRLELRAAQRPLPRHSTFFQRLPTNLLSYLRFTSGRSPLRRIRELGPFLRVVNFYDHSPIRQGLANAQREIRNRNAAIRNWWRNRNRKPRAGDIANYPESDLDGFHLCEPFEEGILRWTQSDCVIRFDRPPERYAVTIRLAGVRLEADLKKSLAIRFNSRRLEPLEVGRREIRILLPESAFVHGTLQALHLHCDEMDTGGVDRRELGLPVLGIDFSVLPADA